MGDHRADDTLLCMAWISMQLLIESQLLQEVCGWALGALEPRSAYDRNSEIIPYSWVESFKHNVCIFGSSHQVNSVRSNGEERTSTGMKSRRLRRCCTITYNGLGVQLTSARSWGIPEVVASPGRRSGEQATQSPSSPLAGKLGREGGEGPGD